MKKSKSGDSFWPSYVDVMTNLFAIALVLFVVYFLGFKREVGQNQRLATMEEEYLSLRQRLEMLDSLEAEKHKLEVLEAEYLRIQELSKAIKTLDDNPYFAYSVQHQKHILKLQVEFKTNHYEIPHGLKELHIQQELNKVGESLLQTIIRLRSEYVDKGSKTPFRIKFLVVIEGQASRSGDEYQNYLLSYQRALSLKHLWDRVTFHGTRFSSPQLNCEIVVSGSGWYGSPREVEFTPNGRANPANQRFLVHIIPVIDWS